MLWRPSVPAFDQLHRRPAVPPRPIRGTGKISYGADEPATKL